MQLTEWLRMNTTSAYTIAQEWGMSLPHLSKRLSGKMRPTFELIVKAHVATGGAVGVEDWIELNKDWLRENGYLAAGQKEKEST